MCACGGSKSKDKTSAVRVETITVSDTVTAGSRSYVGTVEEAEGSLLSFATVGTVDRVLVDVGQYVKQGQTLATIDRTQARAALDMASAAESQAADASNRLSQLHTAGSLPEIKWVEMQSKLREAQSARRIAQKSLSNTRLIAPYSGYIAQRQVDPGNNVGPGVPCFKIVKTNRVMIRINVPENEISKINIGQPIMFRVNALGDELMHAKVQRKGISANAFSHTYDVLATTDNPGGKLLPGMVCRADVMTDQPKRQMVVPQSAVIVEGQKHYIWIMEQGKAHKRQIETSDITDQGLVVSGGIKSGQLLIVGGMEKIGENTPVTNK